MKRTNKYVGRRGKFYYVSVGKFVMLFGRGSMRDFLNAFHLQFRRVGGRLEDR